MIQAIVTDIEGTTSSIAFVKDVLFPHAREHIGDYVRQHRDDDAVREALQQIDDEVGHALDLEQAIAQLIEWIDQDRKVTPLKALQGLVWEAGYRNGDFHGHIYADAVEMLRIWHSAGIRLYVYSSGSEYAQKLLFGHTEHGDLTPLFSGYFDTRIGAKNAPDSYRTIQAALGVPAEQILFLSDIPAELNAAREAGMRTTQLVRDNTVQPSDHPAVYSFANLTLDA